MRIDVQKLLFVGAKEQQEAFFSACQKAGVVEFINRGEKTLSRAPREVQDVYRVAHLLHKLQPLPQKELQSPEKVVSEVLSLQAEQEKLQEEERYIRLEEARVAPFGDFSIDDLQWIEETSGRSVQFFVSKAKDRFEELCKKYPELIPVKREGSLDYFISISPEKESYPGVIELFIETPIGKLKARAREVKVRLKEISNELRSFASCRKVVDDYYIHLLNAHNLDSVQNMTEGLVGGQIFAVEGWVPRNRLKDLEAAASRYAVSYEPVRVDDRDRPPTYLENRGFARIGQDVIGVYDTPSFGDRDPSGWVLWAFALFFAIIVGDAGYGMIFFLLACLLKWRFPSLAGTGQRMVKLLGMLGISCMIWGVLTTSFFGIDIGIHNPVRDISLTQWLAEKKIAYHMDHQDDVYQYWVEHFPSIKGVHAPKAVLEKAKAVVDGQEQFVMLDKFTDNIMLEFSVLIGTLHVILGLLRYLLRSWANAGWALFMVGAYLFFPVAILDASSMLHFALGIPKAGGAHIGELLLYGGIGLAVVLAIVQKRLEGVTEITNIIQVFADVLSYLRLYALGLAGGIMSSTFNDMGMAAGLSVGWLIILVGHLVNITLNVMSGVLHGLRLNFLEWYHYSFEGGGKEFRPLQLLKVPKGS